MIRSLLFAPANRSDLVAKFPRTGADRFVIDLEDGTPLSEKASARAGLPSLVAGLRAQNVNGEVYVRVNEPDGPFFADDISAAIATDIDGIVVPKMKNTNHILPAVQAIERRAGNGRRPVAIMAGIESAQGVGSVEALAAANPLVTSLYFGAEDFVTDMMGRRTQASTEVLFARSKVILAAKLAQIVAVDQIVADLRDDAQFRRDAELGRDLGYDGKMCLTPKQVALANEIFSPTDAEVDYARRLVAAYERASAVGVGTFDFEGKFVDTPILKKARGLLRLAERYGISPAAADKSSAGAAAADHSAAES